jgi:hypothetical protein
VINPYLACQLRHARKVFRKCGQPNLADATTRALGALADSVTPDETEAQRLVHLALGGTIYA